MKYLLRLFQQENPISPIEIKELYHQLSFEDMLVFISKLGCKRRRILHHILSL